MEVYFGHPTAQRRLVMNFSSCATLIASVASLHEAIQLTKVAMDLCDFGSTEDASQLLAAFERNQTWEALRLE